LRIISGKYKGRHLPVRKNFPSRPTTDFAKENLFNILNNHFDFGELRVLDMFSGTGSISYEFASRGAHVDLIEKDYRSYTFIRATIESLKLDNIKAYKADVFKAVPKISNRYDIVFADPPFQLPSLATIPDLVLNHSLLVKGGWLILEHSGDHSFKDHSLFRELRIYGSVHFSIFVYEDKKQESRV
jgi:16S rRNA (guanine(966)-N(2))-methyltransferase RsmD